MFQSVVLFIGSKSSRVSCWSAQHPAYFIAKAGLGVFISLLLSPKYWDDRNAPLCPAPFQCFLMKVLPSHICFYTSRFVICLSPTKNSFYFIFNDVYLIMNPLNLFWLDNSSFLLIQKDSFPFEIILISSYFIQWSSDSEFLLRYLLSFWLECLVS